MFHIISCIGGSEVIYLADCNCDKLSDYLEFMAWEGVPYQIIKEAMLKVFGPPVTDYAALDYEKMDYRNIKEFFLDDFADLKNPIESRKILSQ